MTEDQIPPQRQAGIADAGAGDALLGAQLSRHQGAHAAEPGSFFRAAGPWFLAAEAWRPGSSWRPLMLVFAGAGNVPTPSE
jgi:hypothetical protein